MRTTMRSCPFFCLVQPREGLVLVTKSDIYDGDLTGRHLPLPVQLQQLIEISLRLISLAHHCVRMGECRQPQ